MLIEFSVANFRSLRERQTFSLISAKGDELAEHNTFTTFAANEFKLLRSAAIYGPNAGGKSNFLAAMGAMQKIVRSSAGLQRKDKLKVVPFRLSQATSSLPSEFEIIFIVNGVRYQYGFSATEQRIHEEWLLAYPKGRPQRWFEREWDKENQEYNWELGASLSGKKQLWMESTRDNALFLSTAVQLNSEQLQPVYDWFSDTLHTTNVGGWNPSFSASLCETNQKKEILDFLRAADISIDDIQVEKRPFDQNMLPDDLPEAVRAKIAGDLQIVDIKMLRNSVDGDAVAFELEEESDGTRKLFSFAGPWVDALENGCVLFIDELHDNLHPKLVQFLVQLFHNDKTNPKNAQLVFTTHETSILNQDMFRRDQIWFCEKDRQQATTLYPLSDFSPRKGRENLELAYLSGRYGALPYVRPIRK